MSTSREHLELIRFWNLDRSRCETQNKAQEATLASPAMGHVMPCQHQQQFFGSVPRHTKSITAASVQFTIQDRRSVLSRLESTKIVFGRGYVPTPLAFGEANHPHLDPLDEKGVEITPSPFPVPFTVSTPWSWAYVWSRIILVQALVSKKAITFVTRCINNISHWGKRCGLGIRVRKSPGGGL